MATYRDSTIRIDLTELVSIRSSFLGEEMSQEDVEELSSDLKDRLTWDTLYGMVDTAIYDYMGLQHPQKPHYGETRGDEPAATFEKERKARAKYVKDNFDIVDLDGGSWTIQVPVRKKK